MIVKSLELSHYRNYSDLKISLDQNTNILYGNNAQGKTNILEAIYMSGTSKSHRGNKDREMIQFGQDEAHIRCFVQKEEREYQIDIHLKNKRTKGIAVNKVPIKKASELFGILNLVVFSPEDLNIIKSGPSERRRFIDAELCQIDKLYLYDLTIYNKALNQRNKLLKDIYMRPELEDTLDIWNQQIIEYGLKIIKRRDLFVKNINEIIFDIHKDITGNKENLIIKYEPNCAYEKYEEEFKKNIKRDIRFGQTSIGPHKDDLSFLVENIDIRKFGSQGQQRTCALCLKLSEIELVKKSIHETPVLLLDDVLSELDSERQNLLLNHIHNIQTIITCTGLDEFVKNRFHVNKVFKVTNGTIEENIEV